MKTQAYIETRHYRVKFINRTYWRDGNHPEPGRIVSRTSEERDLRLRVWEVETLGMAEAVRRFEIRRRIALLRRAETVRRNRLREAEKVINMHSENFERKGK